MYDVQGVYIYDYICIFTIPYICIQLYTHKYDHSNGCATATTLFLLKASSPKDRWDVLTAGAGLPLITWERKQHQIWHYINYSIELSLKDWTYQSSYWTINHHIEFINLIILNSSMCDLLCSGLNVNLKLIITKGMQSYNIELVSVRVKLRQNETRNRSHPTVSTLIMRIS